MKKKQAPSPEATLSAGLRRYLYLTAGVTGAAILVVEILGAKMLSPYVGTSHFVWTAQIVVTLLALASGYYLGGRLVESSLRLARLYWCILAAAVYLCFSVPVCEPIAFWALQFNLAVGSAVTSVFLFFIPLTLLAMTGPFLVRVLASSIVGVGHVVGRLSAISTLGSVLGAASIGYVLIPFFPNSVNMFATAGLLMVVVAGYFVIWQRGGDWKPGLLLCLLAGVGLGWGGLRLENLHRFRNFDEVYRGNSNFGLLQVLQSKNGDRRLYLNDYLIQNTYDAKTKQSLSMFTYMLHDLARSYASNVQDVLCIGLGIGVVPSRFANEGASVDVFEINPAVLSMAEKYFDLDLNRIRVELGDGRYLLNRCTNQYDAIVLDAFLGDSTPSHLMSREAFTQMRRCLRPSGVLVINCFGNMAPKKDFLTSSLAKTLRQTFRSVRIHFPGSGNLFFVASDQTELQLFRGPELAKISPMARADVEESYAATPEADPEHGIILTDNYNPVNLDAANREKIRRQLVLGRQSY